MPDTAAPLPDGWDFDRAFLEDPQHLPPYVAGHDSPLYGTSRRPDVTDLRQCLLRDQDAPTTTQERWPHTVRLDGVRAIADDREARRHRLLGPARLALPEELLNRHWLFVGPPGVGKTTQGVLPMIAGLLADRRRSVVVFDPKGDQFGVVRDLAAAAGRGRRSVLRLNLGDPGGSIGWNPLRRGLSRTEALAIATTLVSACESGTSSDSPFWRNTSIELLVDMLIGLDADPDETLTLPRLLEILALPRRELLDWLREHDVHRFASFLESGSHNAETCLCDTNMRLVSLLDLDLCAVLSHGELRLERLFERPTVLVVEMNETRLTQQRPIFNLLAQQILDRAIEAAERRPDARLAFPLSVVVDEFGSAIGAIPRFPVYLNTLRSRRVGVVAAVQSLSQIRALYRAEAGPVLVGFSTKVFFPNVEYEDAEFASVACGTMTVEAGGGDEPRGWLGRRVFLAEEIARPRAHPVLGRPVTLLLADQPAFQAYLTPCFRLDRFAAALAAQSRRRARPRRRVPLVYAPSGANRRGKSFTDTRGLAPAAVLALVTAAERRLGLADATPEVRGFWTALREGFAARPAAALRLAEELLGRELGLTDLYLAYGECGCDDPKVLLPCLDYLTALHHHERRRRDAS